MKGEAVPPSHMALAHNLPKNTAALPKSEHIFPIFDTLLQRSEREAFLGQKSKVVWLTGLSGAGKSTIARLAERMLFQKGVFCQVLDGDNIRSGINSNLGFSNADRIENIRRIAEVARLFLDCGVVTLCSFISPTKDMRQMARQIVGESDFIEVYVKAPLDICEQRDVKGLYTKARRGEIERFTGVSAPYEEPERPALVLETTTESPANSATRLVDFLMPIVKPAVKG